MAGVQQYTCYFMYGSPLLDLKIDRRYETLRPEGQGVLKGWRMTLDGPDGQPNLVEDAGGQVAGLLWLVAEDECAKLDVEETGYAPRRLTVATLGRDVRARVYVAPPSTQRPKPELVARLREAYNLALLPLGQIEGALSHGAQR